MKRLRLILTYKCPKDCPLCCNKQPEFRPDQVLDWDWDLENISEIILTGGEPMLDPLLPYSFLMNFKIHDIEIPVYIHTAYAQVDHYLFWKVLRLAKGITFTIHHQEDIDDFMRLNFFLAPLTRYIKDNNKSMRLYVFEGISLPLTTPTFWQIKSEIQWIPNCPLPEGEILRKNII